MAKTVNRLALQQSLVRNGLAEDPAAGNVADDWGDEIDAVTADLVTKDDLDVFGQQFLAAVDLRFEKMQAEMNEGLSKLRSDMDKGLSALRVDMETRDRERAERESEWWRLQQERDDARQKRDEEWRKEQQAREDDWRREQRERDDKWRADQQKRDDAREKREDDWRKEQRKRDDEAREREVAAAKAASSQTSKILWAIFGVGATLGTIFGIVIAVT